MELEIGAGAGSINWRPLPQPLLGCLRGNNGIIAFPLRPRAHCTLGRQLLLHRSERFLELLALSLDPLRHFIPCKPLVAELGFEVADGVAGVAKQPLGFLRAAVCCLRACRTASNC